MKLLEIADKKFEISKRNTSFGTEFIGGLTTFAAMSYILAVNPLILGNAGMDKGAVLTVTALAAAFGCWAMALLANLPVALAPAMGTNSYFAIIICLGMGLSWQQALALTFYNGIFFLLISLTGIRQKLIYGVPKPLQIGLQCGIGIFIAFLGFQSAHIVVKDEITLVTVGKLASHECMLALLGVAIMAILMARRVKGAIILTILFITLLSFVIKDSAGNAIASVPDKIFSLPHGISETFLQLDFMYPIRNFNEAIGVIFVLLMLDMLDTIATVIAMGRRSGLMDKNGRMPNMGRALVADAGATIFGALLGTSTTGSYVESSAGIEAGAKTGLSSIFVGVFFILALFLTPLIQSVPAVATAPALIIVGIMMMQGLKEINVEDFAELVPAVFCMLMIAFSFKISEGFAFGMIAYVLLLIFTKRAKEISPTAWVLFALMCVFMAKV